MKQKMAKISSLGIGILLLAGLFSWPGPVFAGEAVWSAETIPARLNNVLGPDGIDIRDIAIGSNSLIIYAAPGNSTGVNEIYKSIDGGATWMALPSTIRADLIAVAPDNDNLVVIADNTTPAVYISIDGGFTWNSMGPIQADISVADVILDIEISPEKAGLQYIAVAGNSTANRGNLWYFDYGAPTQGWHETRTALGADAGSEVAALAFSPNFSSHMTVAVISDNATASVKLEYFNLENGTWNVAGGYTGFPCTVVTANLTRLASASLALAPTFAGDDADSRKLFIGLTVEGDAAANATSGIYRFVDTVETAISTNNKIHSIDYNGLYLVAGSYSTTTVYRSANPSITTTTPTISPSAATKSPGGDNRTLVAWLGGSTFAAATSGGESAFARSADNGATFDDISLIDTAITNAGDVEVSSDGSIVYLVTDDGLDTSLWRRASAWKRVYCRRGETGFIVRAAPANANILYLAKKNATAIYYNGSGGAAAWSSYNCNINVQDMAVESTAVAYVIDNTGSVSRTASNGLSWGTTVPTGLNSGATIVSVSVGTLLAGSQDGFVAYYTGSNATWTKIAQAIEAGALNVQVIADENFAINKTIYAASDKAGGNVMRCEIGASATWTDIFNNNIASKIFGLAITGNTLYALEYNAGAGQSTLWRLINPATSLPSSTEWTSSTTTATTDITDATVELDATPRALKVSLDKLWAVKKNGTNRLYSYSDVILDIHLSLQQPADGYTSHVNSLTGIAYNLLFCWARPSVATAYELVIALDEDFFIQAVVITVNMTSDPASVLVGPNQAGANINFMPGTTYYWKIRTTKPGISLYSATRFFTIEPLPSVVVLAIEPTQGGRITGTNPAFSWQPFANVTEYEFMLSDNPEMNEPILDTKVSTTAIKLDITLEYGKTYFWRVRSTEPAEGSWSALMIFTVMPEPAAAPLPTVAPVQGEMTTGTNPTFSWQPISGITQYQFVLSDNPEMNEPIIDTRVYTTTIKIDIELDYGQTYFWQVRATLPTESAWSMLMPFNVMEEPVPVLPQVVAKEAPQVTVELPVNIPPTTVLVVPSPEPSFVTPDYVRFIFFSMLALSGIGIVLFLLYRPIRISVFPPRQRRAPAPSRRMATAAASPAKPASPARPAVRTEGVPTFMRSTAAPEKTAPLPITEEKGAEKSREGAAVIFAAKGFMWMMAEEEKGAGGQKGLTEEERQSLGKKLADKIQDLTKQENLFIKYPQDAAMLLRIWAQYGSRNETNRYLAKTIEARPDNAIRLLKCYMPAAQPGKPPPSADDFTMADYDNIDGVVDPDKIYTALTKVFKFKPDVIEEITPVKPADRNLAFKFMRLHHEAKSGR